MVAQLKQASPIVIDGEFKEWLIALTQEEFTGLEKSLKDEGCRDPLVVWPVGSELILIDGHNRYEICTKSNVPFDFVERHFENRQQAKRWIRANQLNKRNLSAETRAYYIGQSYNDEKQSHGGDRKSSSNSCHLKTVESIAKESKVAPRTVQNAAKFAAAVDAVTSNVGKATTDRILKGEIKAKQRDVQALAKRPKKEQKAVIKKVESGKAKDIGKALTQLDTEKRIEESAHVTLPANCRIVSDLQELIAEGSTFTTLYGDCPWKYGNQGTRAATSNHYDTMTVDELCQLPVGKLAAKNAHLHLWATKDFLFEAKRVMEAWGFEFKSIFVWAKPELGIGNYWRMSTEFMLFGLRGQLGFQNRAQRNWEEIPRGEHSEKPEEVRKKIQLVSPGPYLELFGRMAVPGWTIFGNQVWVPDGDRNLGPIEGPLFSGE